MAASDHFFCVHIRTCAIVIAIIGIIFGILQCLTALFIWWYIPMSIFMLSSFALVLRGIYGGRPKLLKPSLIFLGINIVLSAIIILAAIILGFVLPDGVVFVLSSDFDYNYDYEAAQDSARLYLFLLAFIVFVATCYNILAFIIIYRCKQWLTENASTPYPAPTYPNGFGNAAPPMQQPVHGSLLPPTVYHGSPQPYNPSGYPPQGYNIPQQQFHQQQQQQYPSQNTPYGYNTSQQQFHQQQQHPPQHPPQNVSYGYNAAPQQPYQPQQYPSNNYPQYNQSHQPTPKPDYDANVKF
jgi:hypothetical protein